MMRPALTVPNDFAGAGWRRVADSVLTNSLGLSRGQSVIIDSWAYTVRAADVLAGEARRLGIRPILIPVSEWSVPVPRNGRSASDSGALARFEVAAAAACHGYVCLNPSLDDFVRLSRLPAALREARNRRIDHWNRTLVSYSVPSVHLLAASVSPEAARHHGVSFDAWERESIRASTVNPALLRQEAIPLARRLSRGHRVTITHSNGTHLELGLVGRRAWVDDGAVDAEDRKGGQWGTIVPGGFMAVAVDEKVAEGRFISNRPSRQRPGVIRGQEWRFRDGRLDYYDIGEGRALFESNYRLAGRERDRPAVLVIGLNPEIRDFPYAEDQERGVLTFEIGHNEDFGGRTRGSFRHWATLRGADLFIDDEPILRAGRRVAATSARS
jgi:leucyl aminopeptidase (aminopeptidase T)